MVNYYIKNSYTDEDVKVLELWQSETGWFFFITEIERIESRYAWGFVMGTDPEWGSIDRDELFDLQRKNLVKLIPKNQWHKNVYLTAGF